MLSTALARKIWAPEPRSAVFKERILQGTETAQTPMPNTQRTADPWASRAAWKSRTICRTPSRVRKYFKFFPSHTASDLTPAFSSSGRSCFHFGHLVRRKLSLSCDQSTAINSPEMHRLSRGKSTSKRWSRTNIRAIGCFRGPYPAPSMEGERMLPW